VNSRRALSFSALLLMAMIIMSLSTSTLPVVAEQKGPASDTIIFKRVPAELAAQALMSGDIDYYIFGLTFTQAEALVDVPNVKLYYAPSGLVDIGVNPAPAPEGQLNPFSIRKVRFALNYLMDREYIVSQIYKGFAAPMVTFLSSYDPDYVVIQDIIAKYDFKYDPDRAKALINESLTEAGAVLGDDGKWYYNDNPITIKFVIRIEDERREIGDMFASALESVGFTVERDYMSFGEAISTVYFTDPADLQWHLYTEGWGKGAPDKYDSTTINQMGAPWYGWLPGWGEEGYWQYTNDTIDELGIRIYRGEFADKDERDELYRQCTEMIIQESVRIWAATRLEIHPARTEIRGLTQDIGTGLRSPLNLREVYSTKEGVTSVTIGHLWVHTEASAWNPIGGHDDVYSIDIWRGVHDPCTWRDPFSGLPMPFRWNYTVTTAGPDGNLTVPADAFLWNATSDKWEAVGAGVNATSKVTFDLSNYIGSKWHHGMDITWADVLYSLHQMWEIAYDENKSAIESSISAPLKAYLSLFKGFRIVGNSLEVYLDYWHFSDDYIAEYADIIGSDPPTGHYPFEVLAAMDIVVFTNKTLMYSESASEKVGVPWMSVNLEDHAKKVKDALDLLSFNDLANIFNVSGTMYATAQELTERINAAKSWFNTHKHMVISDGPFYLNKFDAAAQYAELKAFRDPSYPFSKGECYYGVPAVPEVSKIGTPIVVPGGSTFFVIETTGLPPDGVTYMIKNPLTGEVIATGMAETLTPTKFMISLLPNFTETLEPGVYELFVSAYSEKIAYVSVAKEYFNVLNVLPLEDAFKEVGDAVSTQLSTATEDLMASTDRIATAVNNLMSVMAVVAVLVIIDIIVTVVLRLRPPTKIEE